MPALLHDLAFTETTILSAFLMVERRCAITTVVRPSMSVWSADDIFASVSVSTEEVASSRIKIGAS